MSWGNMDTRRGKRARYLGDSGKRSSKATDFGGAEVPGERLAPSGLAGRAATPLVGDVAVMMCSVLFDTQRIAVSFGGDG